MSIDKFIVYLQHSILVSLNYLYTDQFRRFSQATVIFQPSPPVVNTVILSDMGGLESEQTRTKI